MSRLALQLFTVRDECAKDFVKTLKEVSELGYEGVEFAGFHGLSAKELACHLDRLGLKAVSSHTDFKLFTEKPDEVIEYNKELGNKNIVIPWTNTKDEASACKVADAINTVIDKYIDCGFIVSYHNHSEEFTITDGISPIDILLDRTDGKLKLEIDTYWVFCTGIDPSEALRTRAGQLSSLIHLKDGLGDDDLTAIGEGKVDIESIIKAVDELGIEWLIVENDRPAPTGLDDATRSIKHLKENYKF